MVAGKDDHPRPLELARRTLPLTGRDPNRQILQPAQRTARLGQGVLAGTGGGPLGGGDVAVGLGLFLGARFELLFEVGARLFGVLASAPFFLTEIFGSPSLFNIYYLFFLFLLVN